MLPVLRDLLGFCFSWVCTLLFGQVSSKLCAEVHVGHTDTALWAVLG